MSTTMNGVTLDKIIYNGVTLDKIIYNNIVVYESAKNYNLGSYGSVSSNPDADEDANYWAANWYNGTVAVDTRGQKLNVVFSVLSGNDKIGFYIDAYLRNTTTGARTLLGRVATRKGEGIEWNHGTTDLSSPKVFTLPASGQYYLDFFINGLGYDNGHHICGCNISSVTVIK